MISGDLAQDEQLQTYQLLRKMLGEWVTRLRVIPGNHENRDFIRQTFPEITDGSEDLLNFSLKAGWLAFDRTRFACSGPGVGIDRRRTAGMAQKGIGPRFSMPHRSLRASSTDFSEESLVGSDRSS